MIYNDIAQLVGNTPLFEPVKYQTACGTSAHVLCKLEYLNPAGSIKDRAALGMIEAAERDGTLREGSVIIEPTSGNTGIGLAAISARRGYRVILTMPDTMSVERRKLLAAYGAEIVLTDGALGMKGAIDRAEALAREIPTSFIPAQFDNIENANAHKASTAPEILADTDGRVDILVAGVGTGGTITGIGQALKEACPSVRIVAVEPADSPLLSEGRSGAHGLQGIGANFIPSLLDRTVIDEVFSVSTEDAYAAARKLARLEGLLVGITSGAALHAATELAKRPENASKNIVVILPDTGDRYLSTPLFDE